MGQQLQDSVFYIWLRSCTQEISTLCLPKHSLKKWHHQLACRSEWGNSHKASLLEEALQVIKDCGERGKQTMQDALGMHSLIEVIPKHIWDTLNALSRLNVEIYIHTSITMLINDNLNWGGGTGVIGGLAGESCKYSIHTWNSHLKKFLIKNVSLNQRFLLKMNFDLNQTGLQGPVCMRKLLWLHSLAELQGSRVGS